MSLAVGGAGVQFYLRAKKHPQKIIRPIRTPILVFFFYMK
jgi:hypothetical protein